MKPEFARLYPGLRPGFWESAAAISEVVAERRVRHQGFVALGKGRVLSDAHFEFRGDPPKSIQPPGRRRRLADRLP